MIRLKEGVNLYVLPTKKFKTVSIQFRFKTHIESDTITKRALLSNMLDVNSKQYPMQSDFRKRLSELYGASYSSDVARYGSYHILTLSIDFVDEKIVKESNLFSDVMVFMEQVIFSPNVSNGHFHEATFRREMDKLRDDYASRYDDKMTYAEDKLNAIYFDTNEQKMTSYGQEKDLNEITSANLFECYLKMINEDQLDIFVLGNVTENSVVKKLDSFKFNPRTQLNIKPYYINESVNENIVKKESQDVNQTILTMGFETPIYFHQQYYYAGLVFDGLFGSMPHSKLFLTVREENNLAYSISSEVDAYRGMMLIYAGINSKEIDRVRALIMNQLEDMRKGEFSEKDIDHTKMVLKNDIIQIEDTPHSMIEKLYNFSLIGQSDLRLDQWFDKIDHVTRNEIIELANLINLRATYILIGENN